MHNTIVRRQLIEASVVSETEIYQVRESGVCRTSNKWFYELYYHPYHAVLEFWRQGTLIRSCTLFITIISIAELSLPGIRTLDSFSTVSPMNSATIALPKELKLACTCHSRHPFNNEDANIILHSREGVDFWVHSFVLKLSSTTFRDLFEISRCHDETAECRDV